MRYYTPRISLIDKTATTTTPIEIDGDRTGSLIPFRSSGRYVDAIGEKISHGSITLRSLDGLFIRKEPILTDDRTRARFLVEVQMFQPDANFANEVGEAGKLFRFEIANSHIVDDRKGVHITLDLQGWERRLGEVYDSRSHVFLTPKQSFQKRLATYSLTKGADAPTMFYADSGTLPLTLPDSRQSRRIWQPEKPETVKSLLDDVIRQISDPQFIGTTNEDYYYYFVATPGFTKHFNLGAGPLGEVDSGVVVNEKEDARTNIISKERNTIYDNSRYKNTVIVRGTPSGGSLPMDYARYASDWTHATVPPAPEWDSTKTYRRGDYVKWRTNYYKCIATSTTQVPSGQAWLNLTFYKHYTRWTLDVDSWKANMDGYANPPNGYVGFFHDMGIVVPDYERADETNEFELVTLKDVEDLMADPSLIPTGAMQHGRRWLVNGPSSSSEWAGKNGRIAQYDASVDPPVWRFSEEPVEDDTVHLLSTGTRLRHNGTNWETNWKLDVNYNDASTFHPVKAVTLVDDYRGVDDKAIDFLFDWNAIDPADLNNEWWKAVSKFTGSSRFEIAGNLLEQFIASANELFATGLTREELMDTFGTGDPRNKAGRWAGFNLRFPFPRYSVGTKRIGEHIAVPTMDFDNLTTTIGGNEGWNLGVESEDLGKISGVQFMVRFSLQDKGNNLINRGNFPFIYWYRDLFDRIVYGEKVIPVNGSWYKMRLDAGWGSNLKLFDSRIDELVNLFGYRLPHNFFIKERSLTGIKFDWTHVKEMGIFYKDSYDENFFYRMAQDTIFNAIQDAAYQALQSSAIVTLGAIDPQLVIPDHANLSITDLHFIKEAYIVNNNASNPDSRQVLVNAREEGDYNNLKSISNKTRLRLEFQPEEHVLETRGDVRLKPGTRFVRKNASLPQGEQELVATVCEHIESSEGYNTIVTGIKKFVAGQP